MPNEQNKKSVFVPNYYTKFRCIAEKCRHSCCIDWEICIDEDTFSKYKQIKAILDTVTECEDGPCFALQENGRCPHLNDSGLCNIILSYGEDFLSDICKNHPRFFNETANGRIEVGLGIVCEEACRLILESEAAFSLSETVDFFDVFSSDEACCEALPNDFDPIPQRNRMLAITEAPEKSFDEKLDILKKEFRIPELRTPSEWLDRFLSLEILDAKWEQLLQSMKGKQIRKSPSQEAIYGGHYARLLAYFIYRHVSVAEHSDNLRARLAFSILSVEMIRFLFEYAAEQAPASTSESLSEMLISFARRYSAEIEYSEDNTFELIFEFENRL